MRARSHLGIYTYQGAILVFHEKRNSPGKDCSFEKKL